LKVSKAFMPHLRNWYRSRLARAVHLDRVVHHQVHGYQGLDDGRVLPHPRDSAAHGREIAQEGHAGEVLQENTRDDKGYLPGALGVRPPAGKRPHMLLGDPCAVVIPEDRLQHDADGVGKPGNPPEALLLEGGKGVEFPLPSPARVEFPECAEEVVIHGRHRPIR
jgi:hypothetical protein